VLVMGGSQGASGINQAMIKSLPALDGAALQVIHLTGTRDERLVAGQLSPRETAGLLWRRFIIAWKN
jgi:UDP-N-acetylglucosamine:LPS N-acetylglucosamine transferase